MKPVKTFVLDLFAGCGGTSTAIFESKTNIEVVACINHDPVAIRTHSANYPNCMHYIEDIRTISMQPIIKLFKDLRRNNPGCKIAIWASLECTNFSRAKCGPKDCDSRTLAEHMFRYLDALDPDFFWVENVEEFRTWGPLDENGNPDKSQIGVHYKAWVDRLRTEYFHEEYFDELLVAADYGARTIRKRLFLQFSKNHKLIGIPVKTHCKEGKNGKKWLPVKDVLDLTSLGKSIFNRKKPLVPKTHRRIYLGLEKHGHGVEPTFGIKYYGQLGFQAMDKPCCTLTVKDRVGIINTRAAFIKQDYGSSHSRSLLEPMGTLTANPKGDVVSVQFVHNPQYGGSTRSLNDPAATIIARQDKAPIGLTSAVSLVEDIEKVINYDCNSNELDVELTDKLVINVKSTDDEWMVKIKEYMYKHNLSDVMMRALFIQEMLKIQGFPEDYFMEGTQADMKRGIGNSVEVKTGIALFNAIDTVIQKNA